MTQSQKPVSGVIFIAYGEKSQYAVKRGVDYLQRASNVDISIIGSGIHNTRSIAFETGADDLHNARAAKLALYKLSPYDHTLYLDADTIVYGDIQAGFDILADGADMVIVPSQSQDADALWHIMEEEREDTFNLLGVIPVQLQCGVFWFARDEKVQKFFQVWKAEWGRYSYHDQAAFLRALWKVPLRLHLLGRPFNGGSVIGHRHGEVYA